MSESGPRKNPYVGPRSLRYGESIYGRDREARQLFDLLIAERIVLLYSPSGAGKTSLIQAALIPELEKEEFNVLPVIRVSRSSAEGLYPCNPYVMSALLSLEQGVPPEHAIPPEELAAMSFGEYLKRREAASGTNDGTFLIFDQFEEILTIDPLNRAAKTDFFTQVGEALRDLKRWALFAMREDHVAALDPYLRPIPTRLKSTFRLDLLNAAGARVAIQRPARDCGVEFTEEATTKLVDDLRQVAVQGPTGIAEQQLGLYIEPVQLQVVCFRLWEKLDPNDKEITAQEVVGTGDVDSALAGYFAERVAQIAVESGVKERVIREWFDRRLITESGIRSQVMQGSENSRELNEQAIQSLVNVHLIRGEERRGVMWLELAHDRLVKPIRANNAVWSEKNLSVLQHQAAVWHNRGRSDSLCLRAEALEEAQVWTVLHATEMTDVEREFLEVCQRSQDARQGRRLRWVVTALGVVLTIITALAVFAFVESHRATKARDDAVRERNIANARSIASHALQLQDERLDAALLLATEAQKMSDQPGTRGTLLTTAFHNPRLLSYLQGLASPVGAVAFSHDGKLVATGGYDGVLVLWDVKTRRPVAQLDDLVQNAVRRIAFSADGNFLAASSKGRSIAVRDLRGASSGKNLPLPAGMKHEGDVWGLAFSNDSRLLASGGADGKVLVWNLVSGRVETLTSGTDSDGDVRQVRSVAFHPNGALLAAGCADGLVLLWQRAGETWTPLPRNFAASKTTRTAVSCVAFNPDGLHLAVGRRSGAVDLYNIAAPLPDAPVFASGTHDGPVSDLAFSPDGARLISAAFDGTMRLWDSPAMKQVGLPFTGHIGRVLAVAFSADKQTVASGGSDRRAILWDSWLHVAAPGRKETLRTPFSIAFSPDGSYEADGYENGSVILVKRDVKQWSVISAQQLVPPNPDAKRAPIVSFSGDSRRLLTTNAAGRIFVHDVSAPGSAVEIDAVAENPRKNITAVSFNKDGSLIAAALAGKGFQAQTLVWNVATRAPVFARPLENQHDDSIQAVEFSPDGKRLVTGGDAEFAAIWSLADRAGDKFLTCLEEHTGSIRALAFSPDGRTFATASGDNTLILWNAETGKQIAPPLTGHQAPVVTVVFSPDGALLASGSDDTSVILWDVPSTQPTGRLMGHTDAVRALAFAPDSKRLFSASWDGDSRTWELDPDELQKVCRQRANRNLTPTEWAAYLRSGEYRKTWKSLPTPGEPLLPAK